MRDITKADLPPASLGDLLQDWYPDTVNQIELPITVNIGGKKDRPLNINKYRNDHYYLVAKQKKVFENEIIPKLKSLPEMEAVWLHYSIYIPKRNTPDLMNIGVIIDKYFTDCLQKAGKIPNDTHKQIRLVTFSCGGVSPLNGKAIVSVFSLIKPQIKDQKEMKVSLNRQDLEMILRNHFKRPGFKVGSLEMELHENGKMISNLLSNNDVVLSVDTSLIEVKQGRKAKNASVNKSSQSNDTGTSETGTELPTFSSENELSKNQGQLYEPVSFREHEEEEEEEQKESMFSEPLIPFGNQTQSNKEDDSEIEEKPKSIFD